MIKAISDSEHVACELKGDLASILTELTMLAHGVIEEVSEKSNRSLDDVLAAFVIGLSLKSASESVIDELKKRREEHEVL